MSLGSGAASRPHGRGPGEDVPRGEHLGPEAPGPDAVEQPPRLLLALAEDHGEPMPPQVVHQLDPR